MKCARCAAPALMPAAALLLGLSGPARAEQPAAGNDDRGFSYFLGIGGMHLTYKESSSLVAASSSAPANSALIVTGALYAIDSNWLFSVENRSTFNSTTGTETWTATAPTFNGTTLTSPLLQTNAFNLTQSRTGLLLHYRVRGQWFAVAGPEFNAQTYRRFSFASGPDKVVNPLGTTTVDESSSEILLNLGLGLESERVRGRPTHYGVMAVVGVPLWRRLTNTALPEAKFDSARGFEFSVQGRYSWALIDRLQLGAWGGWMVARHNRQALGSSYEMPASRLSGAAYGIELLWKL